MKKILLLLSMCVMSIVNANPIYFNKSFKHTSFDDTPIVNFGDDFLWGSTIYFNDECLYSKNDSSYYLYQNKGEKEKSYYVKIDEKNVSKILKLLTNIREILNDYKNSSSFNDGINFNEVCSTLDYYSSKRVKFSSENGIVLFFDITHKYKSPTASSLILGKDNGYWGYFIENISLTIRKKEFYKNFYFYKENELMINYTKIKNENKYDKKNNIERAFEKNRNEVKTEIESKLSNITF